MKKTKIKNFFLTDTKMLILVLINVLIIFLQECGLENVIMSVVDIACTLLFVVEMIIKQRHYGMRNYWRDGWNILDGVVTILSLPALLVYFMPELAGVKILVVFRALRVFKMFRAARHFPNLKKIWSGFMLALRQSAAFLLAYIVIIFVAAMFNSALFSNVAPQYFATPLDAMYAVFQMCTVEGWYEIPNAVAGNMPVVWMHCIRIYFCLILIGGGIIGMSLINSIFVDAMVADNNDDLIILLQDIKNSNDEQRRSLEEKIDNLQSEIKSLTDKKI
ncbi:MAG: ion transporter [Bacteroidales bacterium]|nr:ion transporter [Bacteroidales bacterium]